MNNIKIQSFKDLLAWQEGHGLVLEVYKETKIFPKEEIYVLVLQIRRCVISITNNITEGFTRKNKKEKNQFYSITLGSSMELLNQLTLAKRLTLYTRESIYRFNKQVVFDSKVNYRFDEIVIKLY